MLFHGPLLHPPEQDGLVHPQAALVTTRGACIARGHELQDNFEESIIVDLMRDPVLIDEVGEMIAPRAAGRPDRGPPAGTA